MRSLAAAAALLHAAAALQPLDRRATLQGFAAATTTNFLGVYSKWPYAPHS